MKHAEELLVMETPVGTIEVWHYPQAKLIRIYLNRQEYDTLSSITGLSVYENTLTQTLFDRFKEEGAEI